MSDVRDIKETASIIRDVVELALRAGMTHPWWHWFFTTWSGTDTETKRDPRTFEAYKVIETRRKWCSKCGVPIYDRRTWQFGE